MTPKTPSKPAELLHDLESIRALLDSDDVAPSEFDADAIPTLRDVVEPAQPAQPAAAQATEPREPAVRTAFRSLAERHLDHELRTAANLILQEVIDDFVPQIEAELKRRLQSRVDQLIRAPRS
ncbi:hypothetical protein [Stutzerimonas balearica]|uniref:DNA polymerase III subunit chi n=1 Tax=Stutzerimonas balearica DSM 6083 TaxID=1123016 RepID=A0A8D3XZQ8_9GAMM|nr:hypothetical protein [Stutzerimonas balearica]AJE14598.1 hypothetical protein CL52_05920 [Stutzerimonas balearica DSM 6083]SDM39950.1 hypothetical protein SAMN05660875_104387 [Stutzerimonas balearica DSM 6083]HCW96666.1 DNA polymerase III subunit chi [Pseudomonas sp.]